MKVEVDLRQVIALMTTELRANGYMNYRVVYDALYKKFPYHIFENRKLVSMVAAQLDRLGVPEEWQLLILQDWFDDKALLRSGYRHLVD